MESHEWQALRDTLWRKAKHPQRVADNKDVLRWQIKKELNVEMSDFYDHMRGIVGDVVDIANAMEHHPDVLLSSEGLSIYVWTHRGDERVTINDGIFAARFHRIILEAELGRTYKVAGD
jgi:pterin-4a-carbinolamine dehydratase